MFIPFLTSVAIILVLVYFTIIPEIKHRRYLRQLAERQAEIHKQGFPVDTTNPKTKQ